MSEEPPTENVEQDRQVLGFADGMARMHVRVLNHLRKEYRKSQDVLTASGGFNENADRYARSLSNLNADIEQFPLLNESHSILSEERRHPDVQFARGIEAARHSFQVALEEQIEDREESIKLIREQKKSTELMYSIPSLESEIRILRGLLRDIHDMPITRANEKPDANGRKPTFGVPVAIDELFMALSVLDGRKPHNMSASDGVVFYSLKAAYRALTGVVWEDRKR